MLLFIIIKFVLFVKFYEDLLVILLGVLENFIYLRFCKNFNLVKLVNLRFRYIYVVSKRVLLYDMNFERFLRKKK